MSDQKNAFVERLFKRQGSALRAYFFRRVRRGVDAAELAQEVYLRLLRIPDVATIRNPEAYLYTVAGNLLREQALQQRRDAAAVDIDDPTVRSWRNGRDLASNLTIQNARGACLKCCSSCRRSARRRCSCNTGTIAVTPRSPPSLEFRPTWSRSIFPRRSCIAGAAWPGWDDGHASER